MPDCKQTQEQVLRDANNPDFINPDTGVPVGEPTREVMRKVWDMRQGGHDYHVLSCGCEAGRKSYALRLYRIAGLPSEPHVVVCAHCATIVGVVGPFEPYPYTATWVTAP